MFYAFLWLGGHLIDLLVSLFERETQGEPRETVKILLPDSRFCTTVQYSPPSLFFSGQAPSDF